MNPIATGAIVVLGAPNDENGRLLLRALERCDQAWTEFLAHPDYKVLTTGGRGDHFNTTDKPHGWYSRLYLIGKGIPETAFLEIAESRNTPEDASTSAPIIRKAGIRSLRVVTSDFHIPRARFCFEREFPDLALVFCPALTRATPSERQALLDHETRALARLKGSPVS